MSPNHHHVLQLKKKEVNLQHFCMGQNIVQFKFGGFLSFIASGLIVCGDFLVACLFLGRETPNCRLLFLFPTMIAVSVYNAVGTDLCLGANMVIGMKMSFLGWNITDLNLPHNII